MARVPAQLLAEKTWCGLNHEAGQAAQHHEGGQGGPSPPPAQQEVGQDIRGDLHCSAAASRNMVRGATLRRNEGENKH
jgi:hypothetical protein